MNDFLVGFHDYVKKKYNAEAGFITMNMPLLLHRLEESGIKNPIICTSINKAGFRMSGGKEIYESILAQKRARIIAMQVLGGGSVPAKNAIEYVCGLKGVNSILFGASSRNNIEETISLIKHYDSINKFQ
jgi:phosphoribosylformimino-5-aminoimidazole carboxamide ribonucleotide (ProFAR) isomerase